MQKKPAGKLSERSKEDVLSVLRVFRYIRDQESDSDHIQGLNSSIDRVCEIYGRDISLPKDDPDVDDVRKTLKILEEEGVDYSLNPYHPNTTLANEHYTVFVYAFEIPEYLGGLPEPSGNWDIVFKDRSVPNS